MVDIYIYIYTHNVIACCLLRLAFGRRWMRLSVGETHNGPVDGIFSFTLKATPISKQDKKLPPSRERALHAGERRHDHANDRYGYRPSHVSANDHQPIDGAGRTVESRSRSRQREAQNLLSLI